MKVVDKDGCLKYLQAYFGWEMHPEAFLQANHMAEIFEQASK